MTATRKTVQIIVNENLLELFNDIFEQSGANSKGDFLSKLLDAYTSEPVNTPPKVIEVEKGMDPAWVVLRFSPAQRKIINILYDNTGNLPAEVTKDLVRIALQFIKVKNGGLFSNEQYLRFYAAKGVDTEEFKAAFPEEITSLLNQ